MNAIEYVKKNGIETSKIHLDRMKKERWINSFFNDLREIVEAWELVEGYGGLEGAKKLHYDEFRSDINWNNLQQALNLVEQCNAKS